MEQDIRKFSKVLRIFSIVFAVATILSCVVFWENQPTYTLWSILITIVSVGIVHLPIKVMIKTVIGAVVILVNIFGNYFITIFTYMLLYLIPALVIQLINSWLRELAHLDSPKQDKIDKLKKRLESLESDDKHE